SLCYPSCGAARCDLPSFPTRRSSDLLERDEHAVLAVRDACREELDGEYGLAAAGRAGEQGGAVLREPALGDHVEAGDSGLQLHHAHALVFAHSASVSVMVMGTSGQTSRPSRTLSLSDRSPITRRSGGGSRLMSVGVARIFSSSASCGFSSTSMIWSSYWPRRSSSQMRRRFAMAFSARGVLPVTYSLRM